MIEAPHSTADEKSRLACPSNQTGEKSIEIVIFIDLDGRNSCSLQIGYTELVKTEVGTARRATHDSIVAWSVSSKSSREFQQDFNVWIGKAESKKEEATP